jgi:hypothetical protein
MLPRDSPKQVAVLRRLSAAGWASRVIFLETDIAI